MIQWAAVWFAGVAFLATLAAATLPSEEARHNKQMKVILDQITAAQARERAALDQWSATLEGKK